MKNDFSSPLVSSEKSGLTIRIAAGYSGRQQSVLFKTGSNDTVFRLSDDKISPACVLSLRNSDEEMINSLDVTNFNSLKNLGDGKDYFVSDLYETPRRYYFRLRNNDGHYVASVDKKTVKHWWKNANSPLRSGNWQLRLCNTVFWEQEVIRDSRSGGTWLEMIWYRS